MKRFAAHRIVISPEEIYPLHYVELDDANILQGIYPLKKEIACTAFYCGTLFLSNEKEITEQTGWKNHELDSTQPVFVFHSESMNYSPAEFGTDNSCGNAHIQRLNEGLF
jgi:hypothetical protein